VFVGDVNRKRACAELSVRSGHPRLCRRLAAIHLFPLFGIERSFPMVSHVPNRSMGMVSWIKIIGEPVVDS
jgi:hypothetical protein